MNRPVHTGGCQCGAVRYALTAEPFNPHVCHCRMCQKAFGSAFAPLASVRLDQIRWTRGHPSIFKSSEPVERGFCSRCGTPLTFRFVETDRISVSLGSLDHPERVAPARQFGIESRLPWVAHLHELPGNRTEDLIPPDLLSRIKSRQHPDGEP
jgi:hypothetical protein